MDKGCAAIVWLAIIIALVGAAIAVVIYVVLPVSGLLVVGLTLVGTIWGAFVAVRNFGAVLIEAHKNER